MPSIKAVGALTSVNGMVAILSVAYSIAVASIFGVSREVEIFFGASLTLSSILRLLQAGQLTEIFLPLYHQTSREHGKTEARLRLSILLNWMLVASLLVLVLAWLLAPWLVGLMIRGFGEAEEATGVSMFRVLLPLLPIILSNAMLRMIGNAERIFGKLETANLLGVVLSIVSLFSLSSVIGSWALVVSFWLLHGSTLAATLLILLRKGFRHRFALSSEGFDILPVFKKSLHIWPYLGANQVYTFMYFGAISTLPQGFFAIINYATQLYSKSNGIFMRPVSVVFFTSISEALHGSRETVGNLIQRAVDQYLAIAVVVNVVVFCSAEPLLTALWGGDKFGPNAIALTAFTFKVFTLNLFVSALQQVYRKVNMTLGLIGRQYHWAAGVQLLSAFVSVLLVQTFGFEGAFAMMVLNQLGLAAVTILATYLAVPEWVRFYRVRSMARWLLAVAFAVDAMYLGRWFVGPLDQYLHLEWSKAEALLRSAVYAGLSGLLLLGGAYLFGVPIVRELAGSVTRLYRPAPV